MGDHRREMERALALALRAIPTVEVVKQIPVSKKSNEVVESEIVKSISAERLLLCMKPYNANEEENASSLASALFLLRHLGVIVVDYSGAGEYVVAATSEPASYFLQNLVVLALMSPEAPSPLQRESHIIPFREVLTSALKTGALNPHLLLSNIIASRLKDQSSTPVRKKHIISVLIKGIRRVRGPKGSESAEVVFLHVYKDVWERFALIGSGHRSPRTEEETARLALDEDLQTGSEEFELMKAEVPDTEKIAISMRRGALTSYTFSIFIATGLKRDLLYDSANDRNRKQYKWFTLDEILSGTSRKGDSIMTDGPLMRRVHDKYNLYSEAVPAVVTDVERYERPTILQQAKEAISRYQLAFGATLRLVTTVLTYLWRFKWRILLLIVIGVAVFALKPFISTPNPTLSNIGAIVTIATFIWAVNRGVGTRLRRNEKHGRT